MLKKNYLLLTAAIAISSTTVFTTNASAVTQLTLASSGAPITAAVGQNVTVNIELTGLLDGKELDSLAATIRYDDALFGPASIALGTIIPNPLDDPSDVLTVEDSGLADVSFLTFGLSSASHIRTNGNFFSFNATALQPGNAVFSFEFVDATVFNPDDPSSPIPASVSGSGDFLVTVVPEPAAGVLMLIGIPAIVCCVGRKSLKS